jgi:hypothetical protein
LCIWVSEVIMKFHVRSLMALSVLVCISSWMATATAQEGGYDPRPDISTVTCIGVDGSKLIWEAEWYGDRCGVEVRSRDNKLNLALVFGYGHKGHFPGSALCEGEDLQLVGAEQDSYVVRYFEKRSSLIKTIRFPRQGCKN